MTTDNRSMEEALQAAVAQMNRTGNNGPAPAPMDPISMIVSLLPKLLENRESRDELAEKLDGMQTEELTPIREQLRIVRQQLVRMRRSQDEVLGAIAELREQQTAIGEAVLHLAQNLQRLEILDERADEAGFDDAAVAPPHPARRRSTPTPPTPKTRRNPRQERS
jgi:hypothetical protein